MIAEVKLRNMEKCLTELPHGNSAVMGSTTVHHVVQCSCDTSAHAFSQNYETIVLLCENSVLFHKPGAHHKALILLVTSNALVSYRFCHFMFILYSVKATS